MPIRAVFFDLDDTLLETHDSHFASLTAACTRGAELHPDWTTEGLREAFHRTYRRLETEMEAGRMNFPSHEVFRTQNWEETLRDCGLPPQLGTELAELYLDRRRAAYRLYHEGPAVLEELRRDRTLVLVTNGLSDLQREKCVAVHIDRWIPHLAISGELESWKPDPGIFRHAIALAGSRPDECVMVGDSLERDIAGAGALGIRTVWVRRYPHLEPIDGITPDAELADLTGLRALLDAW
jgi:HAD superfamily hydrolase (TIGR01509 family)